AGGCDLLCIGTRNTDAQLAEIQSAIDAAVTSGALAVERLADAVARVSALSDSLAQAPGAEATTFAADPVRIASAFEWRDGVEVPAHAHLVALETTANM